MGMTKSFEARNVMNGTYDYMSIDGEEVAELAGVKVEDEIEYEDIEQPGNLRSGKKMTSIGGKGEFTVNKITNKYNRIWSEKAEQGIQPEVTIVTTEADPNALEACTIMYLGCAIENIPYINGEPKTPTKDTYKFSFQEKKYLDPQ